MVPKSLFSSKNLPRWLQNSPKTFPRRSQDASKSSQNRSKSPQDPTGEPKRLPRGRLQLPRRTQETPRGSQEGPRSTQETILEPPGRNFTRKTPFKSSQDRSKRSQVKILDPFKGPRRDARSVNNFCSVKSLSRTFITLLQAHPHEPESDPLCAKHANFPSDFRKKIARK